MRRPARLISLSIVIFLSTCGYGVVETPCGNGVIEREEECDDGNGLSGDGCSRICQLECGDGTTDPGEECDDGNREPDDGCDDRCKLECGNGLLDGGEECEYTLTDGCDTSCRWSAGDGDADGDTDGDVDCDEADIEVPEQGRSLTVRGELSIGSDTWHRPIGACTSLSTLAEVYPYEGYLLRNGLDTTASLVIDALGASTEAGTLADTILFLYGGRSIPEDPLACLASNDDGGEGVDARLELVQLAPGQCAYLVISSFAGLESERSRGTYELVVTTE